MSEEREPVFVVMATEHVENLDAAVTVDVAVKAARINAEEHGGRWVVLKRVAMVEVSQTKITILDEAVRGALDDAGVET